MPRWGGLRPEPYKVSPPDADRDMIVQEGTAWERPGGLRLLDRLGNAIQAGTESLSPVDGLRYVDADGKDVGYVPTWVGGEDKVPGTGLQTLSDMPGVRTVGDMTGGSSSLKDRGLALGDRRKAVADAIKEAQKPKEPEKPEKHPLLTFLDELEGQDSGWLVGDTSEIWQQYEDGEMDDHEFQEQEWQIRTDAIAERRDRIAEIYGRETADILQEWIYNIGWGGGVTHEVRADVVNGKYLSLLDMIADSPVKEVLYRGMALSDEEIAQVIENGTIHFSLGASSGHPSTALEYGDTLFRIEGAAAFPVHYFSPIDEDEHLVHGDFEIAEVTSHTTGGSIKNTHKMIVLRPVKKDDSTKSSDAVVLDTDIGELPAKPIQDVVVPELNPEDVLTPELTAALDELKTLSRELEELAPRTNADAEAGVVDKIFDRAKKSITQVLGKKKSRKDAEFGLEDAQLEEYKDAAIPALTERGQELIDKIDAVGEKIEALSADLIRERTSAANETLGTALAHAEKEMIDARRDYYKVTRPLREKLAEQIIGDVLEYFEDYDRLGPTMEQRDRLEGQRGRLQPGEVPPRNALRRMLSGVPFSKEEDKQIFRERMIEGLERLNVLAVDGVSGQRPLDGGQTMWDGRILPDVAEQAADQVEQLIKEALDDLIPESHKEDLFSADRRRRGLIAHLNNSFGGHRRIANYKHTEAGIAEQPLMDETRRMAQAYTKIKPDKSLIAREVNRQIMQALRPDHGSETFTVARDESFDGDRGFNDEDRALVDEAIAIAAAHLPASWVSFLNRMDYTFHYSRRAVHQDPTADRHGSLGLGGKLVGPGAEGYDREQRLKDGVRQIIHEIGHAMSNPGNGDHAIATGRGGRGNFRYVMGQAFISSQLSKSQTTAQLIHLTELSESGYEDREVVWMFDALRDEPDMAYVFKYYHDVVSGHPDQRADATPDGEVLSMGAEIIMAGTDYETHGKGRTTLGPLEKALRVHSWASIIMGLDDPVPEGEPSEVDLPENELFVRPLDDLSVDEVMDEFRQYAKLYAERSGGAPTRGDRIGEYRRVLTDRIRGRGLMPGDPEPAKTVDEVLARLVELDEVFNPPHIGWESVEERIDRLRNGTPASVGLLQGRSEAADPRERKYVTQEWDAAKGEFVDLPEVGIVYQTWEEWLSLDEGDEWAGIKVPETERLRLSPIDSTVMPPPPKSDAPIRDADGDPVSAKEFLRLALGSDHADGDTAGIPRAAFLAEYQGGNYDEWLIEQIERDWDVTGLTKEHIDQLLADMRKEARAKLPVTITVYRADDGDVVGRFDKAELGPVSVANTPEEASEYGEAVEFVIPREAVEFMNPETGEYVIDPTFLKKRNNNFKDAELNNGTT
tara:strand:+ start:9492 stop:13583 length:4092 start_codon:yes stop_codon:yes gene_type:complete